MTEYNAPLREMRFVVEELNGLAEIASLPGHEDATPDVARAIFEEAGRLGREVLSPLNRAGDLEGAKLENGVVRTPPGFKEAYRAYVDGGWNALQLDREIGGQGLPMLVATPVFEMWDAANLAFMLCPVLTIAGAEMLQRYGSEEQKAAWMPKLVTGEWTGTMVLTEPGAGSDVGALKTRAVPDGGAYRLSGQKIFTTWGDHDFTENIVHMVLARTPGAPPGTRGVSLFVVPKFLVDDDGALGRRNDLRPVSLERKLGIHGSPTCVMQFGENEGAVGYLVGEECRGMEYMFAMMNNARLAVGREGVGIAERAYQQAAAYARERVQGRDAANPGGGDVAIVRHPDVRRNLMTMRALTEAGRALGCYVAARQDFARAHPDPEARARARERVELLVPVVKAWSTDCGVETASLGVQIHGGAGFIEETGAAQHYRDSRITPIYEGTNGIQAIDLLSRKIMRDGGAALGDLLDEMQATEISEPEIAGGFRNALSSFRAAADRLLSTEEFGEALAGATPCLRALGFLTGGWLMAKSAEISARALADGPGDDAPFYRAKSATARFYASNLLPQVEANAKAAASGSADVMALADEAF